MCLQPPLNYEGFPSGPDVVRTGYKVVCNLGDNQYCSSVPYGQYLANDLFIQCSPQEKPMFMGFEYKANDMFTSGFTTFDRPEYALMALSSSMACGPKPVIVEVRARRIMFEGTQLLSMRDGDYLYLGAFNHRYQTITKVIHRP